MELGKMFRFPWLLLIIVVAVRSEEAENIGKSNDANDVTVNRAENAGDTRRHAARTQATPVVANWKLQNCYTCSDCEHIQFNTTVTVCPYNADTAKMHKCVTYVEKYKSFGKPWYVRGCATEKGTCAEIKKNHADAQNDIVRLISCKECEGDLCNSVSRSLPLAFLYFVVTPILTKFALS